MKSSLWLKALVCFLIVCLLMPWGSPALANTKKENDLGKRFHLKVAASGLIFNDPIAGKYYEQITDRIMRGAGLKPGQYNFYIIESDGINAFAVPGGYIYMHTETIISLENEGQLASILGHEVAHITSRHYARRLEAASSLSVAYLAAMLAGVLVASRGGDSSAALGQAVMMGGSGATVQSMLANSREDEAEADAKGRKYLVKAGYDPRDMYGAFKIMADKTYQVSTKSNPTYLSTHPALSSRLATSFSDKEKSPASGTDQRYLAFRDRVFALTAEPQRVQRVLSKRRASNPKDHSAIHGLGLLAARQQNLGTADQLMNAALSLAPNNKEYLADLGDLALRRQKPDQAKAYYLKAGQDNRQVIFGLARASERLGDKAGAARYYDQAVNMESKPYPEALEMASRFFGQNGQKGKGYYYMARYFSSKGDLSKAIFHYKEVVKQPDAGQYRAIAEREAAILDEIKKTEKK